MSKAQLEEAVNQLCEWTELSGLDLSQSIAQGIIKLLDGWCQWRLDQLHGDDDLRLDLLNELAWAQTELTLGAGRRLTNHYGHSPPLLEGWRVKMGAVISYEYQRAASRFIGGLLANHSMADGNAEGEEMGISRWLAMLLPPLIRQSRLIVDEYRSIWLTAWGLELITEISQRDTGKQAILMIHLLMRILNVEDEGLRGRALAVCQGEMRSNAMSYDDYGKRVEELYDRMGDSLKL